MITGNMRSVSGYNRLKNRWLSCQPKWGNLQHLGGIQRQEGTFRLYLLFSAQRTSRLSILRFRFSFCSKGYLYQGFKNPSSECTSYQVLFLKQISGTYTVVHHFSHSSSYSRGCVVFSILWSLFIYIPCCCMDMVVMQQGYASHYI